MSEAIPYDHSNVFAKILEGTLPCHKVYEDAKTLAFLDLMPRTEGHVLVIPKAPCRNLLDVDPTDLQAVIVTVQKVARAAEEAFQADGITLSQFSEKAGGQEIFHLHFHVLPRFKDHPLRPPGQNRAPEALLEEQGQKIRDAIARLGFLPEKEDK